MDVKNIAAKLRRKYKTQDPYQLADALDIIVQYGDLGKVRGFYLYDSRIKLICLNNNLPEYIERFVLSHEIGHAVMHRQSCTPFLQSTYLSVDRLEIEANKFAVELVMPDEDIMEHWEFTIDEWAMFYGLPREIIELRFK